jgi:hypothetical protein
LPPEQPLPVEKPTVEQKKQAHYTPANLIGTQVVEMIAMLEERRERGKQKGHGGKRGH